MPPARALKDRCGSEPSPEDSCRPRTVLNRDGHGQHSRNKQELGEGVCVQIWGTEEQEEKAGLSAGLGVPGCRERWAEAECLQRAADRSHRPRAKLGSEAQRGSALISS